MLAVYREGLCAVNSLLKGEYKLISATSRMCPLTCPRCKVISKWQCDGDDDDDDDIDGDDHLLQG